MIIDFRSLLIAGAIFVAIVAIMYLWISFRNRPSRK